jgi:GNAT superfamily N-acetyltransferase
MRALQAEHVVAVARVTLDAADFCFLTTQGESDPTSTRLMQHFKAGWVRDLDYERVLPLLAGQHDRIVGDATLHRRRDGAHRHMGEVRVTVDPVWRGRGLGTALLRELVDCASQVGLETLVFELIERVQDEAIDAARRAGFLVAARLVNHVKDMQGKPHDLVMMSLLLGKWYYWW